MRPIAIQAFEAIQDRLRITIHAKTGKQPTTGFALSIYPERERTFHRDALLISDIDAFLRRHSMLLALPDHYLGAWVDAGTVYLDVSVVVSDESTARTMARQNGQLAYYAIERGESVSATCVWAHERHARM